MLFINIIQYLINYIYIIRYLLQIQLKTINHFISFNSLIYYIIY